MNVNKIVITGNPTADPELRYTPSGKAVLSASIANNEHFADDAQRSGLEELAKSQNKHCMGDYVAARQGALKD